MSHIKTITWMMLMLFLSIIFSIPQLIGFYESSILKVVSSVIYSVIWISVFYLAGYYKNGNILKALGICYLLTFIFVFGLAPAFNLSLFAIFSVIGIWTIPLMGFCYNKEYPISSLALIIVIIQLMLSVLANYLGVKTSSYKKNKAFIGIVAISIVYIGVTLALFGGDLRIDRFGAAKISWADCIKINDTKYYGEFKRSPIENPLISAKIGEVQFNVSKNVGNPNYKLRNGDATYLDVGTEIYGLGSDASAIAVKIDGKFYLYKAETIK